MIDLADDFRGIARDHGVLGNVFRDHRASPDDRPSPEGEIREDRRVRPDVNPVFDIHAS